MAHHTDETRNPLQEFMREAAEYIEQRRTEEITKLLRFGQNPRPVDAGRKPITDSPLFGGDQKELFS